MTVTKPDGRQSEVSFHGEQSGTPKRQLVIWCPDWPVVAAATQLGLSLQLPLAVFDRGEVFACSAMARVEGVRRGMRRRDASARCPELTVLERNTASEIRTFEDVLSAIEEISAGVAPVRPGLCALRVPSRFYGGEKEAAAVVAEHLVGAGVWDFRIGIADGIFAAEHAARRAASQDCWIIARGGWRCFWQPCRSVSWRTLSWSPCCAGWASAVWEILRHWPPVMCSLALAEKARYSIAWHAD
jgi:protein ImuB